jgi:hypothetical protein
LAVMHAAAVGSGIGLVLRENELIVGTQNPAQ